MSSRLNKSTKKSDSLKKLASLSAFGAGAFGLAAGNAQAGLVTVTDPNLPATLGVHSLHSTLIPPTATFGQPFVSKVMAGAGQFSFFATRSGAPGNTYVNIKFKGIGGNLKFLQTNSGLLSVWDHPELVTQVANPNFASQGLIAGLHVFTSGGPTVFTRQTFSGSFRKSTGGAAQPAYAPFEFVSSGQTYIGWVEMLLYTDENIISGTLNSSLYGQLSFGPELNVTAYAYEPLETGAPEPASFALTGLGALALGAVGVRRWRAAKA